MEGNVAEERQFFGCEDLNLGGGVFRVEYVGFFFFGDGDRTGS